MDALAVRRFRAASGRTPTIPAESLWDLLVLGAQQFCYS